MRHLLLLFCGLGLTLVGGCAREGDENLGLGARHGSVDLAHLTRPAELVRALFQAGRLVDGPLGAHRFVGASTIKVEPPGQAAELLEETYRVNADGHGAVHLWHDNSRGQGTEAIITEGTLYVRPRYGRFVRRRPEGDELDRLRAQVEGVPAGYVELLAPFLTVQELGPARVSGRPALRLALKVSPTASAPKESEPGRRWRESLRILSVEGELTLDTQTGIALEARLEARYAFAGPNERGPVVVTLGYKQWGETPEAVLAPADALETPRRVRPMIERNSLLDGLVTR